MGFAANGIVARRSKEKAAKAWRFTLDYDLLERQLLELIGSESNHLANASNFSALVFAEIPNLSWAGFYYPDASGDLVLGPFQGKPACARLPKGHGVCGAAFTQRRSVVVDDVQAYADHIVCDAGARSEMVVPLLADGEVRGVFDLDSASPARFGLEDRRGIERLVIAFVRHAGLSKAPAEAYESFGDRLSREPNKADE
ncbi:MAG: GAF domain-containing protein [Candidatus Tyrphobacter sp.]